MRQRLVRHDRHNPFLVGVTYIEAVVGIVFGVVFFLLKNPVVSGVSLFLGPILSLNRALLQVSFQRELEDVHSLAEVMDLYQSGEIEGLEEVAKKYLAINDEAFRPLKQQLLESITSSLKELGEDKRSQVLTTSDYYEWLLPMLGEAKTGSRIWAISLMLDCEWNDSPYEEKFLEGNIEAAARGVVVERLFIVPRVKSGEFLRNKAVVAYRATPKLLDNAHYVFRETLEDDPKFLKDIGDGFIAFDERVALIDVESNEGMRGYVTIGPGQIQGLVGLFSKLKKACRPLKGFPEDPPALPGAQADS